MNTNKDPFVYRVFVFLLLSCLLVHLIYLRFSSAVFHADSFVFPIIASIVSKPRFQRNFGIFSFC